MVDDAVTARAKYGYVLGIVIAVIMVLMVPV
jgi:hypothetical protein